LFLGFGDEDVSRSVGRHGCWEPVFEDVSEGEIGVGKGILRIRIVFSRDA